MSGLRIPQNIVQTCGDLAQRDAPLEACGLLAGRDGTIVRFYPMTNADASADHYTMVPSEQFAAIKDMRALGLRMLAIWHSHPATPARMSEEDIRLAFTPDVIYVIQSLAVEPPHDLRGFRMEDGRPVEVPVQIVEDAQA